jgi:hypothetical protein
MGSAPDVAIQQALEGTAEFFSGRKTRAAVVARRLLGIPDSDDDDLTDQLIRERRRRTRLDGSLDGSLMETAWSAWELLQLGCPSDHPGVNRMVGYLLSRQDKAGRWGEGCSERRHGIGHCRHSVSGFFSPGSRDESIAPLTLANGTVIASEYDARFAASCFALRVVLAAGQDRRSAVRQHVESLFGLVRRWRTDEFSAGLMLGFCALGALGLAPFEDRSQVTALAAELLRRQDADGYWPGVPLFHALDCLWQIPGDDTIEAIARATPALLSLQRATGAFDESADEQQALIGVRALRIQAKGPITTRPPQLTLSTKSRRAR